MLTAFFDLRDQFGIEASVDDSRNPHELIMEMEGIADIEGIGMAFFFQICGNDCFMLAALSNFDLIAGVDSEENRKASSGFLPDAFDDESRKSRPFFKACSEFIGLACLS